MVVEQEQDIAELRQRIRHSTAHVMADVVTQMFPETKLAIGPPTDDGFYYDFLVTEPFKEEDLEEIERRMKDAAGNLEFEEAARLRDEIKRLEDSDLGIGPSSLLRPRSTGGRGGTRTKKNKGSGKIY